MEVRALSTGFYGGARRREGEVFNVKDGEKAKWFEPLEHQVDPKAAKAAKAEAEKAAKAAKAEAEKAAKAEAEKADKVEAKAEAEAADLA